MTTNDQRADEMVPERSPEEQERILKAAREAKTLILAVGALTIGSMIFMVLIVFVMIGLDWL